MATFAYVEAVSLVVIALVGWLVAGRLLAPVRLVRQTAQQISETDLTRRIPAHGRDDVSELARTFNAMLDRLEDSFATQRQFLDDAGHELRTPITIVRGHLELMGPDDDPAEHADTRALVLDELDRMSRLVDDLVTLAKAERPDFLRRGPVQLRGLVEDMYEKARAIAPRTWQLAATADGTVYADRQRLTQALVQLADNAAKHTTAGDRIVIGSTAAEGVVRLSVSDTGPGVDPADTGRILARFARGADSGHRGDGSGLGLAIVRAIAEAHDGRVTLDSPPGGGATFTLEIPATRREAAR
jgi:signal transduction histidine kinase